MTPTAIERKLSLYFEKQKKIIMVDDVVLVQCVEDLCFFSLFGLVITSLRGHHPIRVEQFVLNSLRVRGSGSIFAYFRSRFVQRMIGRKWVNLYQSYCDCVGYRATGLQHPLGDMVDALKAFNCWLKLKSKDEIISIRIGNIPVGDLINDSYLRFRPAATVHLKDFYLCVVIWQAYRDVRRAKKYFGSINPKLYITSYSSYIQHGIPARVALHFGVKVCSILYALQFCKELSLDDWTHVKNPDNYAFEFSRLKDQERKLAEAEAAMEARISGVIDNATAYMKTSAYAETEEIVPDVKGALVVFLHNFFDSPHAYRNSVFPDFWEWICYTIETCENFKIRVLIKPHPTQISSSIQVLGELADRYPNANFISPNITNRQLVNAGMVCAVTVHGTVAHEMAYLGVPTICCGDNPHVSFNFCNTTKSREEYANALKKYSEISKDKACMRRESLAFYYMHNLKSGVSEIALMRDLNKLNESCEDPKVDGNVLLELLINISDSDEFKRGISKLANMVSRLDICPD